ncbi:MAG: maleylpyruvate isomerase N-terminal domain-containing protein [Actinomycetia bacterium]|nr:maleylpyruvate isomerase N-terminal domain-containing protein [Actinomycetes bacterium]
MLDGAAVREVLRDCIALLASTTDRDWNTNVPGLDLTVAQVVAHIADTCLWYAIDLAAAGSDLKIVEHKVNPSGAPADLVEAMRTYATIVASVIDSTPPDVRGFHPFGMADPCGFAAMACDEMLIHTDDAARGLGLTFEPNRDLVEQVLRRLFPWVEVEADPWQLLQWANGRTAFEGHPKLERWRWHCAPLDEWTGERPD